jgi:ABC-type transporter Mla subunit MlaD
MWRTLSRGLMVYGVIGLLLALVGLVAAVSVNGYLTTMNDQLDGQIATASKTIDSASAALTEAASTASSAASTLDATSTALTNLHGATTSLASAFRSLEQTTASVSILGLTPLASVSSFFGDAATQLETASSQVGTVGTSLHDNHDALTKASAAASDLATSMNGLKASLESGTIQSSIDQLRLAFITTLLVVVLFFAFPAIAALIAGWRLRRSPA